MENLDWTSGSLSQFSESYIRPGTEGAMLSMSYAIHLFFTAFSSANKTRLSRKTLLPN